MSLKEIPRLWRWTHHGGITKGPSGEVVAELENPGRVIQMGDRLFEEYGEQLRPAGPETVKKARIILFEARK